MELHIFDDGISYLNFLKDEDENKMYFRAEDLYIITGVDVVNVIKKKCLLIHEDEIFINEDGFNSIFFKFPLDFRCWYYSKFVPFVYTFI